MSWFQALQVYLLSLFEKLRDPFVLLWFMSVHLEVTQAAAHRAVNGQRRPAALWLRLRRGQRLEATSISGPCGLFLSLWCDFKTFKYEWTANSRTWRVIIARSFRKNGFWQKISEQIDVYAAIFEPKRKWNWHLAHVQPTRPVSFARPQCCSAAGTLFSVGSASSQCTDSSSPSSFYRFSIQT